MLARGILGGTHGYREQVRRPEGDPLAQGAKLQQSAQAHARGLVGAAVDEQAQHTLRRVGRQDGRRSGTMRPGEIGKSAHRRLAHLACLILECHLQRTCDRLVEQRTARGCRQHRRCFRRDGILDEA